MTGAEYAVHLKAEGMEQVSTEEFTRRWKAAGFSLEVGCCSTARILTGPLAGETHPYQEMIPNDADGRSIFHFEQPDKVRETLSKLRREFFALDRRGNIWEV